MFSSMKKQYSAAIVEQVSTLEQTISHQTTVSALRTLDRYSKDRLLSLHNVTQDCPLDPTKVVPMGVAPENVPLPVDLLSLRRQSPKCRIFSQEEKGRPRSITFFTYKGEYASLFILIH